MSNTSAASSSLPACRYGRDCYRVNPLHLNQFSHPEGHSPKMKRSHPADEGDSPSSSKRANIATPPQLPSNGANDRCSIDGLHLVKVIGLSAKHNVGALSLSDVLRIVRPTASIHFNFMIDLEWLLRQYPTSNSQHQMTLVVGESGGTDFAHISRDAKTLSSSTINIKVARARLFLQYGSHHTKMSMFKSNDNLHVLISTANLIERDWSEKTQGLFICSGRSKGPTDDGAGKKNDDKFRDDLLEYLNAYSNSKEWPLIKEWCELINAHDFSSAKARLIASVPGYHRGADKDKWGHMRLRSTLRSVEHDPTRQLIAQFSSIGSLGAKPETWVCGQFLQSLLGGQSTGSRRPQLVYPTVSDVRNSLEGYIAGASLPYQSKTAERQPWLGGLLHRWTSDIHGRTRAMPHIKSYALVTSENKVRWMLLTSANLSKAAWGELQKSETQLMVRSYELGVLLEDDDQRTGMDVKMLPYDWPLTKYASDDRPWITDEKYKAPDVNGMTWPPY